MALHDTRETTSLAHTDDVHKAVAFEDVHEHALSDFEAVRFCTVAGTFFHFEGNFTEELHGREIVLGKVALHRLGQTLFLHELDQSDLRRLVAVTRRSFMLRNDARSGLQYGCRANLAPRIKQLRHADFLSQNSRYLCHFLLHSQRGVCDWLGSCGLTSSLLVSRQSPKP